MAEGLGATLQRSRPDFSGTAPIVPQSCALYQVFENKEFFVSPDVGP
jgi:hypothetical protein